MSPRTERYAGCLCLLVLAGCAERIPFERESSLSPLPEAAYIEAARSGAMVYRVLPEESLLLIRVGRAGKMANLGHDHAVASEDLQGYIEIAEDRSASHADVVMPLKSLIVDQAEYRERLSLDSSPSPDDIAGTYSNMRRMLDAEQFPWVHAEVRFVSPQSTPPEVAAAITLHGLTMQFLVPVQLDITASQLTVRGLLSLTQSEFGLTPFSSAGGLLRVADELQIEFTLAGIRVSEPAARNQDRRP